MSKKRKKKKRKRKQNGIKHGVELSKPCSPSVFKPSVDTRQGQWYTTESRRPYSLLPYSLLMAKRNAFEVATWPCSEEYLKNPSIVDPAFELLEGPEGRWGLTE